MKREKGLERQAFEQFLQGNKHSDEGNAMVRTQRAT